MCIILLGWLVSKLSLVKLSSLQFVSRLRDFLGLQWASDKKFCRADFEMFIKNHFHVRDMMICLFVGPLQRVRPRNGILALVLVLSLRSEFIGEL